MVSSYTSLVIAGIRPALSIAISGIDRPIRRSSFRFLGVISGFPRRWPACPSSSPCRCRCSFGSPPLPAGARRAPPRPAPSRGFLCACTSGWARTTLTRSSTASRPATCQPRPSRYGPLRHQGRGPRREGGRPGVGCTIRRRHIALS